MNLRPSWSAVAQLAAAARSMDELAHALAERRTVEWVGGLGRVRRAALRRAGVELLTASQVRRRGHRVRRGAVPVVLHVLAGPGRVDELWLWGVQTSPLAVRQRSPGPRFVQQSLF